MANRITANLPAIGFDETEAFYHTLGFKTGYRDDDWMIMGRGDLETDSSPTPSGPPARPGSAPVCGLKTSSSFIRHGVRQTCRIRAFPE